MDKRAREIEVNKQIGEHIERVIDKSGRGSLCFAVIIMVIMIGAYLYTQHQWTKASGVFKVPMIQNKVVSHPIEDREHAFDDTVAIIQNSTAIQLTELLNTSTSSFPSLQRSLSNYSGTFKDDLSVNFDRYKFLTALSDPNIVRRVQFELTHTPLLIDAKTDNGTQLSDIPFAQLNSVTIEEAVVQVEATVYIRRFNIRAEFQHAIRFDVTVHREGQHWAMISMSAWEPV